MRKVFSLMCIVLLLCVVPKVNAADSLVGALKEGKPYLDLRIRYEIVAQDGIAEDAHAFTARTRFGFKTAEWNDLTFVAEGENIAVIGNEDYNNTRNGKTDHPTVADVESTEINQLFLEYKGFFDLTFKVGRQVITEDNHRFIGHVGWRQNNQTYDAVKITNTTIPDTEIKYGFIGNVNRIFGDGTVSGNFESNSHYYKIANTTLPIGKLTHYGYIFDFHQDSPANSNKTLGGSLSGKVSLTDDFVLKYYAEYAHQTDYGDNPTTYDANYYHFAPALFGMV